MTHIIKMTAKTFLGALCLSASAIVPVSAAEVTFLPDIPANQIARDTARSFDSRTGISIVTAPTFDPFEQDNTLAGTASLRTGPSEIAIDGTPTLGGAYLDLKMIYTSPSDDPFDLRGFERAFYVSGDPIARIRQDARTLDCAANTTEVIYQDNYYNNFDNYGYLAGVYLLLPRYRGHRGFWAGNSRHRPFAGWSDWRYRSGFNNYGNNFGNRGYYTSRGRQGRVFNNDRFNDDRRGGRNNGRGNDGTGRGNNDNSGNVGNVGNIDTSRERHTGRDTVIGGSAENREYRRQRGVVTGGPLETSSGNTANTPRPERGSERRARVRAERRNSIEQDRVGRRDSGRGSNPLANTTRQPIMETGRPAIRETLTNQNSNLAGRAPAPVARQAPPAYVSRPAAVSRPAPEARPAPAAQPRAERSNRSNSQPSSRPSRSINREVDRSFRNNNRSSRNKQLDFFPMLGGYTRASSTVVTNYRCVREETVTLHIPQERLDAARFDGMTLVIVDNADRDIPVYLPPNYIEGFRQAAASGSFNSQTTVVTPQPSYTQPNYSQPSYNQPDYGQSNNQGGYPQN